MVKFWIELVLFSPSEMFGEDQRGASSYLSAVGVQLLKRQQHPHPPSLGGAVAWCPVGQQCQPASFRATLCGPAPLHPLPQSSRTEVRLRALSPFPPFPLLISGLLEWRRSTRRKGGVEGGAGSPWLPSEHHMGSSLVLLGARGRSQNSHDNEARGHSECWPKAGAKSFW